MRLDITPQASSSYTQAVNFLGALFRDAPDNQFLEYRIFRKGGAVVQQYHQLGELKKNGFGSTLPLQYDGRANVYYGVCPRLRRRGTRDDVGLATAVWFDEITRAAPDLPPLFLVGRNQYRKGPRGLLPQRTFR